MTDTMLVDDLRTAEGAIRYAEKVSGTAAALFREQGELHMMFFVIGTQNLNGEPFDKPAIMIAPAQLLSSNRNEQSHMIRNLVIKTKALGIVTVLEAWGLHMPPGRERSDYPADLSNCADAFEAVVVMLEHRDCNFAKWSARITRDSKGTPSLAEFVRDEGIANASGRFATLLNGFESDPMVS